MEQCQVQAFPLCLHLHSKPLMLSSSGQKGGLKCWFTVGPGMEPWSNTFLSWNACLTQLRYRLCWAMSWVRKSSERTVTLTQDHQLLCSHSWYWDMGSALGVTAMLWESPAEVFWEASVMHVWKQGHCHSRVGTRGQPCPSLRLDQFKNKVSFRL